MKLIKKANKTKIRLSHNEWLDLGKKAGWLSKSAAEKLLKRKEDFSLFNPDDRIIKNTGTPAMDDPIHYDSPKSSSDVGWGSGSKDYYYPPCGTGGDDFWYSRDKSEVTCPKCLAIMAGKPVMEEVTCPMCNGKGKVMVEK